MTSCSDTKSQGPFRENTGVRKSVSNLKRDSPHRSLFGVGNYEQALGGPFGVSDLENFCFVEDLSFLEKTE